MEIGSLEEAFSEGPGLVLEGKPGLARKLQEQGLRARRLGAARPDFRVRVTSVPN